MTRAIESITQQILCAVVITLCLPAMVLAQQDRLVDWYPVLVQSEANVLEIVDINVAGKSITISQPFIADDNWLNTLTFKVRNISGKTIEHFGFGVAFPELQTNANRGTPGFSVTYFGAESVDARYAANAQKRPLIADEEVDLKMPEDQLAIMRQISLRLRGTPNLSKLNITLGLVRFEDGSGKGAISFRREAREKH